MFPLDSVLRGPHVRARANVSSRAHRSRSPRCSRPHVEALEERQLLSATPSLLADIAVGEGSSPGSALTIYGLETSSSQFLEMDGVAYFTADTEPGAELWKTDGTEQGTVLVKNIGSASEIRGLRDLDGTLFFFAGTELWTSDGTEQGTTLVKAFVQHPRPEITAVNSSLFFRFESSLWKSDGTEQGTVLVRDFGGNTWLNEMTSVGGTLFFRITYPVGGAELWKSDGTEQGTTLVKHFPADFGVHPRNLRNVSGTLFFNADDGVHGEELWKSDGTEQGTVLVKDISETGSSAPSALTNLNGTLVFTADDGVRGRELWRSDGTAAGTVLIEDVNLGGADALDHLTVLSNVDGTLYFVANDGTNGYGLWKSDGSQAGTVLVKDIYQGSEELHQRSLTRDALSLLGFDGGVLFRANDGTTGYELWRSDGTEQGTVLVKDINPGLLSSDAVPIATVGGSLLLVASDPAHGRELWKTDGTEQGTVLVTDLNSGTAAASAPRYFTSVGNLTYFVAGTAPLGGELYRTDGTQQGTFAVTDLMPGAFDAWPQFLTNVNGVLYFMAREPDRDLFNYRFDTIALYKTDGTAEGTVRVKGTIAAEELVSTISANGRLFFTVRTRNEHGRRRYELWSSDGTQEGTVILEDRGSPRAVAVGDTVFFLSWNSLWKTDGVTVEPVVNDPDTVRVGRLLAGVDDTLYFVGFDTTHGLELWKTDGTAEGTRLVKDINPGFAEGVEIGPSAVAVVDGELFFRAVDASNRTGLWRTDGTEEGTTLVTRSGAPTDMTNVGGTLFFRTREGTRRYWWASDGSEAGTIRIDKVEPVSGFQNTAAVGDTFYFIGDDGSGEALWQSDGTLAGTVPVDTGGAALDELLFLTNSNGVLYFSANDGARGAEPWLIAPEVVAGLFYNNADVPSAHDKLPYYAGSGPARFENVSSYVHGINGIHVDLPAGHGPLTADDFTFKIGTGNDPQGWATGPTPAGISVQPAAGVAGKDRVQIVWPDGAIKNTWLQVTVKGNDEAGGFHTNTGLEASTTFYFGSRVGDAGGDASPVVFLTTAADPIAVRRNAGPATSVTARYDFDQNGMIDGDDELIARANFGFLPKLDVAAGAAQLASPPADGARAAIAAALAVPEAVDGANRATRSESLASTLQPVRPNRPSDSPHHALVEAARMVALHDTSESLTVELTLDDELLDGLFGQGVDVESWRLRRGAS